MVKYGLVVNEDYASTLEETSGDWTLTAYYTLNADGNLDAMEGTAVVAQASVGNMQVDTQGNCSADVLMDIMDQATNDGIATGTLTVRNQSEDNDDWTVFSSSVRPRIEATINNVSTGEGVTTISSTDVLGVDVEINEGALTLVGEVIKRDISLKTARRILTAVVDALQSVTLADPTVVTYTPLPVKLSGSYYNLRSSDARTAVYGSNVVAATGFGDAAHSFPKVTVTDTDHQYAAELGTLAGTRIYSIRSGEGVLSGSANIPIPSFEAQLPSVQTLLMNQHGEIAGIMITQLHIPDFDLQAPVVSVTGSTVTAALAAATAESLTTSLIFQNLTKNNLNA